jgi:ABC-2 type transport system ATP-binding protein
MTSAIVMHGLTKDYGSGHGLFDLDLEVAEGEVFGFLGPNGAGKTTTIRLLMGVIHPSAGTATVFGLDCDRDSVAVKREVGYLPGDLPQFGGMRGSEVVAYLGGMRGGIDAARVTELAERLELDLGRRFREYSRGNKQKLGLVLAFMHRPRLLILDEPTGGLDPLNQQTFQRMVGEVKASGSTVFLSSHVLSEVEETCSRVGIIRDGGLVSDMTMDKVHDLRFHEVVIEFGGEVPEAAVRAAAGVEDVAVHGTRLTCTVHGGFGALIAAISGHPVVDMVSREPSLESIFLSYYSK